jgi:hypothetical protein
MIACGAPYWVLRMGRSWRKDAAWNWAAMVWTAVLVGERDGGRGRGAVRVGDTWEDGTESGRGRSSSMAVGSSSSSSTSSSSKQ